MRIVTLLLVFSMVFNSLVTTTFAEETTGTSEVVTTEEVTGADEGGADSATPGITVTFTGRYNADGTEADAVEVDFPYEEDGEYNLIGEDVPGVKDYTTTYTDDSENEVTDTYTFTTWLLADEEYSAEALPAVPLGENTTISAQYIIKAVEDAAVDSEVDETEVVEETEEIEEVTYNVTFYDSSNAIVETIEVVEGEAIGEIPTAEEGYEWIACNPEDTTDYGDIVSYEVTKNLDFIESAVVTASAANGGIMTMSLGNTVTVTASTTLNGTEDVLESIWFKGSKKGDNLDGVIETYNETFMTGTVSVSKTAEWTDYADAEAKIQFGLSGTTSYDQPVNADVIIVLDASTSMVEYDLNGNPISSGATTRWDAAVDAVEVMIDGLLGVNGKNPDNNNVSLITFAGKYGDNDNQSSENSFVEYVTEYSTGFTSDRGVVLDTLEDAETDGGTDYTSALAQAIVYADQLEGDEDRELYVVFISDGAPDKYNKGDNWLTLYAGQEQAEILQEEYDATIYAVSIGTAINTDMLKGISNTTTSSGDDVYQTTGGDLSEVLTAIIGELEVVAQEAVITDVIASGFEVDVDALTTKYGYTSTGDNTYTKGGATLTISGQTVTIDVGNVYKTPSYYDIPIKATDDTFTVDTFAYTNASAKVDYANLTVDADGSKTYYDRYVIDNIVSPKLDVDYGTIDLVFKNGSETVYTVSQYKTELVDPVAGATGTVTPSVAETEFEKWASASNYSFNTSNSDASWTIAADTLYDSTKASTDVVFYVTAESYILTYDANGGTGEPSSQSVLISEASANPLTISSDEPNQDNYKFLGWSATKDGEVEYNAGGEITLSGNTTLYAVWAEDEYTVTYETAGGTEVDRKTGMHVGAEIGSVTTSKTGYTFAGWTASTTVSDLDTTTGAFTMLASDVTLTASWTAATDTVYTVEHYKQNIDGTYNGEADATVNKTGTTNAVVNAPVNSYEGFTSPAEDTTTTINADGSTVIVYQYTRNAYTVEFVNDGGAEISSETYKYGATVVKPTETPKTQNAKAGYTYTFAGWSPSVESTVTGNATYTATYASATIKIPEEPTDYAAYADNGVYSGTYDGEYHDVVFDVVVLDADDEEVEPTSIAYSVTSITDENDTNENDIPEVMDAGSYPVTITITVEGCEEPIVLNATAVVEKIKLTVEADDKTINYGGTVTPSYTITSGTFVKTEGELVEFSYEIADEAFVEGTLYTVIQSGSVIEVTLADVDVLKNYTVETETGILTVNPATLKPEIIEPEDPEHDPKILPDPEEDYEGQYDAIGYLGTYNAEPHDLVGDIVAYGVDGVDGETLTDITVKYLSVNDEAIDEDSQGTVPQETEVGIYLVEIEISAENYETQTLTVIARIETALLTVTASDHTITYGDAIPTPEATPDGLQGEDNFTFVATTEATSDSPVGPYATTVTQQTLANYDVTYVDGEIVIKVGTLDPEIEVPKVPVDPDEPEIDDEDDEDSDEPEIDDEDLAIFAANNGVYEGTYDADTHNALFDVVVYDGSGNLIENANITYKMDGVVYEGVIPTVKTVGEYPITITVSKDNYEDAIIEVTAIVYAATVTVTAINKLMEYGTDVPELTYTVGTMFGTDGITSATITTDATSQSPVGTEAIAVSDAVGTGLDNYSITYVQGTITIYASDDLVVTGTGHDGPYDGDDHEVVTDVETNIEDADVEYSIDGGETWTDEIPTIKDAGEYEVIIRVTKDGYEPYEVTIPAEITPAAVTITVADAAKSVGASDPSLSATVIGLIGTDTMEYTVARADDGETAGTYGLTATYTEDANYTVTVVDGVLTITAVTTTTTTTTTTTPTTPEEPVEEEPTVPTTPATVTPAAGVGPADEPVDEAEEVEEVEEVVIEDDETPLASADEVVIEEDAVPLAAVVDNDAAWALLNLILAVLTAAISVILLIGYFINRKSKEDEEDDEIVDEDEEEENKRKNKGLFRLLSIIPALVAIIAFILTEDMTNPMIIIDRWTIVMLIIALVQLVVALASRKKDKEDDEENEEAYVQ